MWAGGGLEIDEGLIEEMRSAGALPQIINAFRASLIEGQRQRSAEILPENWHAVRVFLSMASQWRVVARFDGLLYLGLDHAALQPSLEEHCRIRHRQPLRRLMPQLRILERAARPLLNGD